MSTVKARILARGNVQGVGFRAYAKQIAKNMQIKGFAMNLPDGGVEVHCEAEKSVIEKFMKRIYVKGEEENPFSLHVNKIEIAFEGEKGYVKTPKEFEAFEIDYGENLTKFERESLERTEIGALILSGVKTDTSEMKRDISGMKKDMSHVKTNTEKTHKVLLDVKTNTEKTHKVLLDVKTNTEKTYKNTEKVYKGVSDVKVNTEKVYKGQDEFRNDTNQSFGKLDDKYGAISKRMLHIQNELSEDREVIKEELVEFKKSNEALIETLKRLVR